MSKWEAPVFCSWCMTPAVGVFEQPGSWITNRQRNSLGRKEFPPLEVFDLKFPQEKWKWWKVMGSDSNGSFFRPMLKTRALFRSWWTWAIFSDPISFWSPRSFLLIVNTIPFAVSLCLTTTQTDTAKSHPAFDWSLSFRKRAANDAGSWWNVSFEETPSPRSVRPWKSTF